MLVHYGELVEHEVVRRVQLRHEELALQVLTCEGVLERRLGLVRRRRGGLRHHVLGIEKQEAHTRVWRRWQHLRARRDLLERAALRSALRHLKHLLPHHVALPTLWLQLGHIILKRMSLIEINVVLLYNRNIQ